MVSREEKLQKIKEAISETSSGIAYICSRTWSAWGYGTMTEDDFEPLEESDEFIESLAEDILNKLEGLPE